MLSSLALTLGMLAVGADTAPAINKAAPPAAKAAAETAKPYTNGATTPHSTATVESAGDYSDEGGNCSHCGGGGCSHCASHERRFFIGADCGIWVSCCNMPQRHAYYPQDFGYYYFRPYNYTAIRKQQEIVANWGGDRRHPYDVRFIFDKVYADLESEGLIQPEARAKDDEVGVLGPKDTKPEAPKKDEPKKIEPPKAPVKPAPGDSGATGLRQPGVVRVEYVQP